MENFRPILVEQCEIALPDIAILRFSLNRHLPESNWIREHQHPDFEQILLYLTGSGIQRVGNERWPVAVGTAVVLPRATKHAFIKTKKRAPLCLAIDLNTRSLGTPSAVSLSGSDLSLVKRELIELSEIANRSPIREAGLILSIAGRLIEAAVPSETKPKSRATHWSQRVIATIQSITLREIQHPRMVASKLGVSTDYLSRSLKEECGLSLSQFVSEARLKAAKHALKTSKNEIQWVGESVGILDANYFARWFRLQTGISPREWRKREGSVHP